MSTDAPPLVGAGAGLRPPPVGGYHSSQPDLHPGHLEQVPAAGLPYSGFPDEARGVVWLACTA
jgi:hypothetical protein